MLAGMPLRLEEVEGGVMKLSEHFPPNVMVAVPVRVVEEVE
jgi:hypothetical protein